MKSKKILFTILAFVMKISIFLGFAITAQAAGSGTIYMRPSSEWINSGGRFAVHYFTSTGDQWVNMSQVDGRYYSANVTDCEILEFCVMQPYTSENVDENVMHRSVTVEYPSNNLNCYNINSGVYDGASGSWSVAPFASNDTAMYIVPTQSWIDSGYRIVAEFVVSGQSKWSEATLAEGSSEYYKLGAPYDFETVTFHLMSGSVITSSGAVESTEPFYYELIKEGDTATNTFFMDGNFWGYTDEGIFNVGNGGNGEEGEEVGGETTQITNVMFGDSEDNLTNEGNLCDVISSLSETIYIQLTDNVTLEEKIVVDGKDIYLDLAGYEINVMTYGFVIKNEGYLTLSDSSEVSGRVYSESGTVYLESEAEYSEEEIVLFDVKYQSNITFKDGNYSALGGVIVATNAPSTITVNGGKYETSGSPIFQLNRGGEKLYINGGSFFTDSSVIEINSVSTPRIKITDFDEEVEHISIVLTPDGMYDLRISSLILIQNDYLMAYDREKSSIDYAFWGGEPFYVGWCHRVSYDVNGGTLVNLHEYSFPIPGYIEFPSWDTMSEPNMMEFSHWECNGQKYDIGDQLYVAEKGTTTLKAMWKNQVQYNVTLHSNDGTNKTQTTKEYSMYTPLYEVPSGWTVPEELYLAGWALEPDGTPSFKKLKLTGDTNLYAIYKMREYRITFQAIVALPNIWDIWYATKYHNEDYHFPEPYPVLEGHDFKGWSETLDGEVTYQPDGVYTKNEGVTLYAVWEEHSYTVSYDLNYGVGDIPTQTKMYTQDLILTEVVPTREGYDFMGWSDTATGDVIYKSGDAYTQNSNITLYAVWKLKEYTITYDANGGENTPVTQTKIHNDDLTLSSQIPTKIGYEFKGWSETLNGEVIYQPGGIYTKNELVTLYAVWEIVEFNIISYDAETKTATMGIPEAGAYSVVFADYENGRLANIEVVPVTVTDAEMKTATITKSFDLGTNDKIMLWQDMTNLVPLCEAYIVK